MFSRRHVCWFVVYCLLMVMAAAPLAGQESAARKAELRAALDTLVPARNAARLADRRRDSLDRVAKLAEEAGKIDTVMTGPFRLLSERGRAERGVRLFDEAWRKRTPWLGTAEPLLRNAVFVVQDDRDVERLLLSGLRPLHFGVYLPPLQRAEIKRRTVNRAIGGAVTAGLAPEVREWLSNAPLAAQSPLDQVYRELASAVSSATKDCYRSVASRCIDALGITGPGPKWSRWYSVDDLRALILANSRTRVGSRDRQRIERHECFAARDDQACIDLFIAQPTAPLSMPARASFIDYLLREVNPDGLHLLTATSGQPIEARLTALANGDLTRAAVGWRGSIEVARPEAIAGSLASRVSTVVWLLILGALAMRSTRWRLS